MKDFFELSIRSLIIVAIIVAIMCVFDCGVEARFV